LDTFFDYPKWILGWILTWPSPKLSRVNPSPCQVKSARVDLDQSRAESIRTQVKSSRPKPNLSRVSPIQSRVESNRAQVNLSGPKSKSSRHPIHVKPRRLGPRSSQVDQSPCWVKLTRTHVGKDSEIKFDNNIKIMLIIN